MKSKVLLIAITAAILAAITIGSIALFINSANDGKFAKNTFIASVDISQKNLPEAKIILKSVVNQYLEKKINIELLGKTKAVSIKDLGLQILSDETVATLEKEPQAKLSTIIDRESLINFIEKTFKFENLKPKSATFFFDPNKKLSIKDSRAGLVIDEQDLINQIKANAQNLLTKDIQLKTTNQEPSVTKVMLEAQQENIKQALDFQFTLLDPVYTGNWDLKLKNHLDWIDFVQKQQVSLPFSNQKFYIDTPSGTSGENTVTIEINQDKLNEYIDAEISKWLDRPAEPVKIYTDASGKAVIEGKGSNGKKVQRRQLKKAIEIAVTNRIPKVTIPVISIEPSVSISPDLQDKGIKEVIAVGHTSYYGSHPGRLINVKNGASKFSGLLLAPDEEFSFNKHLGPVDATTGFVKELVIKAEGTIPEYGGGICQVSTTMYRAALFAGFPIVERNQHSYVVSYYSQILGDGLDATIYLGGPNLKFKNNTGHHILVQTYTEANDFELYIVFYGTSDGRKVTLEGPYLSGHSNPGPTVYVDDPGMPVGQEKQVEKPHVGFNALWYRYITDATGKVVKEDLPTHYKAIPARIIRGTAAPEPAPAASGSAPVNPSVTKPTASATTKPITKKTP